MHTRTSGHPVLLLLMQLIAVSGSSQVWHVLQPPIELLRQFMDMGGWYGRDNAFRTMTEVQFVAAMGTPGGGRTFITDRYLRHFNLVALSQVRHTSSPRGCVQLVLDPEVWGTGRADRCLMCLTALVQVPVKCCCLSVHGAHCPQRPCKGGSCCWVQM